jgi:hypothetical protein
MGKKLKLDVDFRKRGSRTIARVCFRSNIAYRGETVGTPAHKGTFKCGEGSGDNAAAALVDAMQGVATGLQFRAKRTR